MYVVTKGAQFSFILIRKSLVKTGIHECYDNKHSGIGICFLVGENSQPPSSPSIAGAFLMPILSYYKR